MKTFENIKRPSDVVIAVDLHSGDHTYVLKILFIITREKLYKILLYPG